MKTDYFGIMAQQIAHSIQAAELLRGMLADYHPETLKAMRDEIHVIEHAADGVRHEALSCLARDFITPIERDDLLSLVQILDDVTDAIDEVAIDLYMYNITKLPVAVIGLTEIMLDCVRSLQMAVAELHSYKKPKKLMTLLVEVNTMESKADSQYIEAMHELFSDAGEATHIMGVKAVYDALEHCCDLCEHAADVIENAVMNNT